MALNRITYDDLAGQDETGRYLRFGVQEMPRLFKTQLNQGSMLISAYSDMLEVSQGLGTTCAYLAADSTSEFCAEQKSDQENETCDLGNVINAIATLSLMLWHHLIKAKVHHLYAMWSNYTIRGV